ncbi:MAG TPA: CopG family transcriptional regulator [Lichenihabitans sp.]|nr:CopG family transcriptional regulator [Lichenihabitans sp.]
MRTTLTIDDDVLLAARALAEHKRRSLGAVISDLARRSLETPGPAAERNGIPLLGVRPNASPVTLEIVNALRDEMP